MHGSIQKTVMEDKAFFNSKLHNQVDLIDYLTCDPQWPVCLFDFTF
jgi:hypothetical protein